LGEQLVSAGLLSPEALEEGLELQRTWGGFLGEVLVARRLLTEQQLLHFLADRANTRYITGHKLGRAKLDDAVMEAFPVRDAERLGVMPLLLNRKASTLVVAVSELEPELVKELKRIAQVSEVTAVLALRSAVRAAIKRFYYADVYAFASLQAGTYPGEAEAELTIFSENQQPDEATGSTAYPGEDATGVKAPQPDPSDDNGAASRPQERRSTSTEVTAQEDLQKMLEAQRRELHLLRVANALQQHLARERNVGDLVHRVLAFAFDNLPADDGVMLLRDELTQLLTPRAVKSRLGPPSEVHVSESLLNEVLVKREGLITMDARVDPRFRESATVVGARVRSAMGVPILVEGQVRGVIILVSRGRSGMFKSSDLDILSAIAAQAGLALENAELTSRIASDAAVRERLARFMSPALVEMATSGKLKLGEAGELQEVTVLFADIRNFTSLSERLGPREVVALLNEHFEAMVDLVFSQGGTLDKFIGDAVMALWGAPVKRKDDPARSVRCALGMIGRVQEMNERRAAQGRERLEIGVGINTGTAVFGAMGASRRLDLTAIGDSVNTASRLCSQAQPGQVIASGVTLGACAGLFIGKELPRVKLKGKEQLVSAYLVTGERALTATASFATSALPRGVK
jgi:adenylate cyclase